MLRRNLQGSDSLAVPNLFARELIKKKQTQTIIFKPPAREGWKQFQHLVLLAGLEARLPTLRETAPTNVRDSTGSCGERCQTEKFRCIAGNPLSLDHHSRHLSKL